MNPTVYTQSDTHTDEEAPTFHFSGLPRIFEWGWGANRGEWEIFLYFCCCKYPIFTHSHTLLS